MWLLLTYVLHRACLRPPHCRVCPPFSALPLPGGSHIRLHFHNIPQTPHPVLPLAHTAVAPYLCKRKGAQSLISWLELHFCYYHIWTPVHTLLKWWALLLQTGARLFWCFSTHLDSLFHSFLLLLVSAYFRPLGRRWCPFLRPLPDLGAIVPR